MSEDVKPALDAEEWAHWLQPYPTGGQLKDRELDWARSAAGVDLHALAALALYGQPFGFDFTDRDRLREIADQIDKRELPEAWSDRLRDVAARIAALLPPDVDNAVDKPLRTD